MLDGGGDHRRTMVGDGDVAGRPPDRRRRSKSRPSSTLSARRPEIVTRAPAAQKCRAIPSPIPDPPPVTSTDIPWIGRISRPPRIQASACCSNRAVLWMPDRCDVVTEPVVHDTPLAEAVRPHDGLVVVVLAAPGDGEHLDLVAQGEVAVDLVLQLDHRRQAGHDRMIGHDARRHRPVRRM